MYENLINTIVLWDRRLVFEKQQLFNLEAASAMNASSSSNSCRVGCKPIFTWNYKFEKDFQPLFNSLGQDCVAVHQPC
ncbi:hypothetical protein EG832_10790 [bacterium]|nr:hypothetical protein [bacterium]